MTEDLAIKLSTESSISEMFDSRRDKYVLATLLNPCFKGRIETMPSPYAGTDCWKDTVINNIAGGHTIMHLLFSLILPLSSPRPSISHKAEDAQAPGTPQSAKEVITAYLQFLGLPLSARSGAVPPRKNSILSVSWEESVHYERSIGVMGDLFICWEVRS